MFQIAYYMLWPLLRLVMPRTKRVRVLIVKDDTVLVVQNRLGSRRWHLVGGGMQRGETIEETARREVGEELGIELQKLELLFAGKEKKVMQDKIPYVLYFARAEVKSDVTLTPNFEIKSHRWVKIDQIDNTFAPEVGVALRLSQYAKKC